jgi:hypothetical protein
MKKEDDMIKKNWFKSAIYSHWFLIGIIIILLGTIIVCLTPIVEYNNFAVILGFVGILATMIVIGNYAQVKDIESKFDAKANSIKLEIEDSIQSKTNEIWCGYYYLKFEQHKKDIGENILRSIFWGLLSMEYAVKIKDKHKLQSQDDDNTQSILDAIREVIETANPKNESFKIRKECKLGFLKQLGNILVESPDIDISFIYDYINKIQIYEENSNL